MWSMKKHQLLRLIFFLSAFLFINACSSPGQRCIVYVGTYTGGGSDGIYAYHFNPADGNMSPIGLVAKTDNPSFLTLDPNGRFLYAVNEIDSFHTEPAGGVSVFEIDRESARLSRLQQISSLGAGPAHLSLDRSSRYLMVANYNSGNAAVFPIGVDGKLGTHSAFIQNTGSGLNPDRQAGPHAHFIQVTNDNKFAMIADLGIDEVQVYRFNSDNGSLTPADPGFVKLNPGSGPRHIAFAPSGNSVYVLNELSSTVSVFDFDPDSAKLQIRQIISTLPDHFNGLNTAAEILADHNGRFLYVSNRGDDSIVVLYIDKDNGSLIFVDRVPCGGKTPRNFEIDPTGQWMLVANQDSDNISLFRIDRESGRLIQTTRSVNISTPVCIRFIDSNE
jgi:6-phosphogluconolactonase